jgi:hypothetical protein
MHDRPSRTQHERCLPDAYGTLKQRDLPARHRIGHDRCDCGRSSLVRYLSRRSGYSICRFAAVPGNRGYSGVPRCPGLSYRVSAVTAEPFQYVAVVLTARIGTAGMSVRRKNSSTSDGAASCRATISSGVSACFVVSGIIASPLWDRMPTDQSCNHQRVCFRGNDKARGMPSTIDMLKFENLPAINHARIQRQQKTGARRWRDMFESSDRDREDSSTVREAVMPAPLPRRGYAGAWQAHGTGGRAPRPRACPSPAPLRARSSPG